MTADTAPKLTASQYKVLDALARNIVRQHPTCTGWEFYDGQEWFYVPKGEMLALWKLELELIEWYNEPAILFTEWRITDAGRRIAEKRFGV